MIDVNEILHKTDWEIDYLELEDRLKKYIYKSDSEFTDCIKKVNNKKLENALIYLDNKENKSDSEKIILEKYNNYILELINDNIIKAVNNTYFLKKLDYADKYDCMLFGVSIEDIINKIHKSANSIFNKFKNNESISDLEHEFYRNILLYTAYNRYIDGKDINEINDYFAKYKIDDYNTLKDKQLYLLSLIVKYISNIGGEVCIRFEKEKNIDNNYITHGSFAKLSDNRYIIFIYDMDLYSVKNNLDFYKKTFTVLHELGHLVQEINNTKYSKSEKNRIDMEKYFINNEKEFYMQNHHSFFIEIDAEMFAIKCMMNEFGSIKEVYNMCLEELIKINSILDKDEIFNNIEKQRYNAICNNKIR